MTPKEIMGAMLLAGATCLPSAALQAETLAELDALSDAAQDERGGIEAAQALARQGAYLEALATLERMLAVNPKSAEGRLLHALYLCRIDDIRGGLVEIGKLKEREFGRETLADARSACEAGGEVQ
ncbi:hypothetical protein [Erythrobacter sp.]|jgi:tetratricopeptide (TPR) repeat protein|uniref:hypothetical protein n=1 Tax=Erythrobacter sp. TaxID=1042 RepID=UPI001B0D7C8F|nr:hypothetical protein [Erythrobacter sp.]MBO6526239.1 hypothetical protein [Erythrobacter sp.]MBO6530492.1 hypothetical protein [Erythrobacter sp.]